MVGSIVRLAAAAVFCLTVAGCASSPESDYPDGAAIQSPDSPLQCVPFARAHSGVNLYGDAYTWWDQAAGRFARSSAPSQGAVMVLHDYAGPDRAHVAVVRSVVSSREIRIDHANWLDDGQVYLDDPVRDVSPDNDWSLVRVYNLKAGAWGVKTYPVQGFIGPGGGSDTDLRVASQPSGPAVSGDPIATLIAQDQSSDDGDN